eukprot:m.629875 g.629875  ORF g.629875 m.629875 type:complete len:52 (+) comp22562_c1_seq9:100-255(+)
MRRSILINRHVMTLHGNTHTYLSAMRNATGRTISQFRNSSHYYFVCRYLQN